LARAKIALSGAGQIGGTLVHIAATKELDDIIMFDIAESAMFDKSVDAVNSLVAACKGIDSTLG
jgi:malate dehydrogenase